MACGDVLLVSLPASDRREQSGRRTNLVLIEPELLTLFPDTESVNRALRLLADTAESATAKKAVRRKASNGRLKRSA